AEWGLAALAGALVARGHRVTVVTPNWGAPSREEQHGVRIVRFPFPRRLAPGRRPAPAKWLANPFFYLWATIAVCRVAKRERADVIHAQNKHSLIPATVAGRLRHRREPGNPRHLSALGAPRARAARRGDLQRTARRRVSVTNAAGRAARSPRRRRPPDRALRRQAFAGEGDAGSGRGRARSRRELPRGAVPARRRRRGRRERVVDASARSVAESGGSCAVPARRAGRGPVGDPRRAEPRNPRSD